MTSFNLDEKILLAERFLERAEKNYNDVHRIHGLLSISKSSNIAPGNGPGNEPGNSRPIDWAISKLQEWGGQARFPSALAFLKAAKLRYESIFEARSDVPNVVQLLKDNVFKNADSDNLLLMHLKLMQQGIFDDLSRIHPNHFEAMKGAIQSYPNALRALESTQAMNSLQNDAIQEISPLKMSLRESLKAAMADHKQALAENGTSHDFSSLKNAFEQAHGEDDTEGFEHPTERGA